MRLRGSFSERAWSAARSDQQRPRAPSSSRARTAPSLAQVSSPPLTGGWRRLPTRSVQSSSEHNLEARINTLCDSMDAPLSCKEEISASPPQSGQRRIVRTFTQVHALPQLVLEPNPLLEKQLPEMKHFDVKRSNFETSGNDTTIDAAPPTPLDQQRNTNFRPSRDPTLQGIVSSRSQVISGERPSREAAPKSARSHFAAEATLLQPPKRDFLRIYYSDFLAEKPAVKPKYAGLFCLT